MNEKLKEWRLDQGLTVAKLGQSLDRSPSAISNWENGQSAISLSSVRKWIEVYNINPVKEFGLKLSKTSV